MNVNTGNGIGSRLKADLERHALSRIIVPSLTGEMKDLSGLLELRKAENTNDGLDAFLGQLERDIAEESGFALLLSRVGSQVNKQCKKKLVTNLIYNWNVEGSKRRTAWREKGYHIPNLFVISPTMRCNLHCTGCYSGLYQKDGDLTEEEIDDVLTQARELGMYFCVISGGEPYVLKDMWLRLFRKYNDMYFLTFTNGTFLDEETVAELAQLGNVAPAISVEGYEEETDSRRGKGVYKKVCDAMERLKRHGVIFGSSVTYTGKNSEMVSSKPFVETLIDKGVIFSWYFMFMPVGKDPILELVPSPMQRLKTGRGIARLRKELPIFLADFWNDGPAAGGCLAGGRSYFHILNSGRVEPCVFVHFGKDNIREKRLLDIIDSDFFKAIRREFPYNENGNLMRPCMIIDNPEVLRKVVRQYIPEQGHRGSEDIVCKEQTVRWIDNYAKGFKDLTEDEWLEEINKPDSRWYKEKPEYRGLFRFQEKTEEIKETESAGVK